MDKACVPKDQWVEIPDEELAKKGKTQFVYVPSNYPGPIALDAFGGQDPPAHKINPDYQQQPSKPRKCIECGKTHDTILENRMTGERTEEFDKCKDCLMAPLVTEHWKRIIE